ncbi:unnamed protein product [Adineta steineri]|uniref:Globin-sensor domain-containing protein n=1 Tax=Adineta steineri TaxID=433720 RepID=A0A814HVJ8_9BILA|nr:unnamed protein product [Adineta steineri]CAF1200635.1 unnamed protein product [Adineta steineri]CAF1255539.1 unnamed protein product [Adineta steineri]
MAVHIDKNRLNVDLRYRFDYISKCIDFTSLDIHLLNTLTPIIIPLLPDIVEKVYKKLYSSDITQNYFLLPNDGFEQFSPNKEFGTTLISVQVDYRKDMLSVYLRHVLAEQEWNDTFLQYLSRVGEIHTNKGGAISINVDYIHINTLLSFLETTFIGIIWDTEKIDEKEKLDTLRAINKFFWIQNDFFTMHYGASIQERPASNVSPVHFTKCCFH